MKIGIISTYPWLTKWDNYGTLFQNYALQNYLNKHGHETYWIRSNKQREQNGRNRSFRLHNINFKIAQYLWNSIGGGGKIEKIHDFNFANPRRFNDFLNKYVPRTKDEYDLIELLANPPEADAYIVGSDQIWKGASPLEFLCFGASSKKRIAYALSASWGSLSDDWFEMVTKNITHLDAVSVRESDGLDICSRIGRPDAVQVLDPTMLLNKTDYLDLVAAEGHDILFDKRFIFCYFVNLSKIRQIPWPAIKVFSDRRQADLRVVPLQGAELIFSKKYVFTPSPTEWLNAYEKSICVLTNSFHGVLFSIIMRKPFLVLLQNGKMAPENCRFISILSALDIPERILEREYNKAPDIERKMDVEIRWNSVEIRLAALRKKSERFLLNGLEAEGTSDTNSNTEKSPIGANPIPVAKGKRTDLCQPKDQGRATDEYGSLGEVDDQRQGSGPEPPVPQDRL